ncbi:MAG: BlaI/MecI/CopY family transcriptional regulator, partial [Verrucomicrobiales bacterium]
MKKRQPLSASETDLLKVLWKHTEATVPNLVNALNERRKPDDPLTRGTVQVLLNRVEVKGWVSRRKLGRGYLYKPTTSEASGLAEFTQAFRSKVFDGSALQLVQSLVKTQDLQREELDELRSLLDKVEA